MKHPSRFRNVSQSSTVQSFASGGPRPMGTPSSLRSLSALLSAFAVFVLFQAALLPQVALAQDPETAVSRPELIRVFQTDSLYIYGPQLSPDGRWIVFQGQPDLDQAALFAVASSGGELHRLTGNGFHDWNPQWSPDGRFIYFSSDRVEGPKSGISFIMRIPFDPITGQSGDVPRPVTFERSLQQFSISHDGAWLAYFEVVPGSQGTPGTYQLKVCPSSGGTSTTLSTTERPQMVAWRANGSHLIYAEMDQDAYERDQTLREIIWEVSRDGGDPQMLSARDGLVAGVSRSGETVLWRPGYGVSAPATYALVEVTGETLGRFALPVGSAGGQFGRELALASSESGMPIFLLPLAGGNLRPVRGFGVEGYPLGWLPNGRLLLKADEEAPDTPYWESEATYYSFDVDSESFSEFSALDGLNLGPEHITLPGEGSRALIQINGSFFGGSPGSGSYEALDLESGARQTLFESESGSPGISDGDAVFGRGGTSGRDLNVFYYLLWQEDRRDLYRVGSSNVPELVWTFRRPSPRIHLRETVAVHGDRIAWIAGEEGQALQGRGIGQRVMLGNLATGEARELYRTDGRFEETIAWSNDGTRLAVGYRGPDRELGLAIFDVDPTGATPGDPEIFLLGAQRAGYDLRWLPGDDSAVLLAMGLTGEIDTEILLLDLGEGGDAEPRVLTTEDPYFIATFELSPDGRYIAYGSERPATSVLWRMVLPDVDEGR